MLWRESAQGLEILLVHRERYDDWSLPKGKLKEGERWDAAAVREVEEETRLPVQLRDFAGVTYYEVENRPKVVLFWNMTLSQGILGFAVGSDTSGEVDQVAWLTPNEAQARLNYQAERALVALEAGRLESI